MNRVLLMGRLTKDPEVRYTQNDTSMAIARFSLAVDRRRTGNAEQTADFINIVAFGKLGEFSEKYLHKGTKVALEGRIQTGSYTNKDGAKVYTTDVVADNIEFAESKNANGNNGSSAPAAAPQTQSQAVPPSVGGDDGFMNIPDGIDEELPFS